MELLLVGVAAFGLLGRQVAAAGCSNGSDGGVVDADSSKYICEIPDFGPCDALDVFVPPLEHPDNPIDVNISVVFLDLEGINEREGVVTMRADIQIWWLDCRWSMLIQSLNMDDDGCLNFEGIRKQTQKLAGYSAAWTSAGLAVRSSFAGSSDGCTAVDAVPWTPVPQTLMLGTSSNPRSHTDGDVFFMPATDIQAGLWSAIVQDVNKIDFPVTFSYAQFPFDKQVVDLHVDFDGMIEVKLLEGILSESGLKPYASVSSRSLQEYTESEFSKHVSQHVIDRFSAKGFTVSGISITEYKKHAVDQVHFEITIERQWGIHLVRLFAPWMMLTFIPFVGFCLPVNAIMPRIATGFISFLSMTVFRNMAYGLIPKTTAALLWVDAVSITQTEIMWLAVIQNIVAQMVNRARSQHAAWLIDKMAERWFSALWLTEWVVLISMGVARTSSQTVLIVSQAIMALFVGCMTYRVVWIIRSMGRILLGALAQEMMSTHHLWHEPMQLEKREVDIVFRLIDLKMGDGSGAINVNELVEALKRHGLEFGKGGGEWQNEQELRSHVAEAMQVESSIGLDDFRKHFNEMVGGEVVRKRVCRRLSEESQSRRSKALAPAEEVPSTDLGKVEEGSSNGISRRAAPSAGVA